MSMPVMRVRIVDMAVTQRCVTMRVTMPRARRQRWFVEMVVMPIVALTTMHMAVGMLQRLVRVQMSMALARMQPYAQRHQPSGQ